MKCGENKIKTFNLKWAYEYVVCVVWIKASEMLELWFGNQEDQRELLEVSFQMGIAFIKLLVFNLFL